MFVCTGNICRSPMAEALLRARATAAGIPVAVSSSGELFEGRAAEPGAVAALERMGIDLKEHRSRLTTAALLDPADLILTMEHRHVREVVVTDGGDLARTFTLPDFVARAEADGPRTNEAVSSWIARLAAERTAQDVMRADFRLEVPDPMGGSKRVFRQNASQIDSLIARFVAVTWPDGAATPEPAVTVAEDAADSDPVASSPSTPTRST